MDQYFNYLDDLRKQGIVNPFNAASYLKSSYTSLTEDEARNIAVKWAATYSERNPILLEEGTEIPFSGT